MENKKINLFAGIFILLLLLFIVPVLATGNSNDVNVPELPKAGILPDNPFYFLQSFVEDITLFLNFSQIGKAERNAELASKRLVEIKELAKKEDKLDILNKTFTAYENHAQETTGSLVKAVVKGGVVEKTSKQISKASLAHILAIEKIKNKEYVSSDEAHILSKVTRRAESLEKAALRVLGGENLKKSVNLSLNSRKEFLKIAESKAKAGNSNMAKENIKRFEEFRKHRKEVIKSIGNFAGNTDKVKKLPTDFSGDYLKLLASIHDECPKKCHLAVANSVEKIVSSHIENAGKESLEKTFENISITELFSKEGAIMDRIKRVFREKEIEKLKKFQKKIQENRKRLQ